MMARIVVEAEPNMAEFTEPRHRPKDRVLSISETICESIAHAAEDLDMAAIAVFTETGNTARMISKYRPKSKIYAFSGIASVCNRMNLLWAVDPLRRDRPSTQRRCSRPLSRELLRKGCVKPEYVLGVVAGR